jgi:carboxylesterase type B
MAERARVVTATGAGAVRGYSEQGLTFFREIPFAQPPVGELRFRPTRPVPGLGRRAGRHHGRTVTPRRPSAGSTPRSGASGDRRQSEDCLTLNICMSQADGGRRPALVWMHGGVFAAGTGAFDDYRGGRPRPGGQSAGAVSTALHLGRAESRGLFTRAVIPS